jgi:hypothetical protein
VEQIAIISFTNYSKGQSRACMSAVMDYTMQDKKTLWEGKRLVTGVNCRPETVYTDFLNTKLLYHKDNGKMFYHMVQSFPSGERLDPNAAHSAALKLAEYFTGREVLVCTHVDREHIHSHFIINSVSLDDGKKLHVSGTELDELRKLNDTICKELNLPVFKPQPKKQSKSMSGAEYHTAARGESWKFMLMNTIDECMCYAKTRDEFISLMRSEGYELRWTGSRKYITCTTPDGFKCRDNKLHDNKYLKESMELEFRIREELISGRFEKSQSASTASPARDIASHSGGMGRADEFTYKAELQYSESMELRQFISNGGNHQGAEENILEAGTGWESERETFIAVTFASADYTVPGTVTWVAGDSGLVAGVAGSLVQLGRSVERLGNDTPIKDATTIPTPTDKKKRKIERSKQTALGHKADDSSDFGMKM